MSGDGLGPGYRAARRVHARRGRTYFLATRLLPGDQRPAVHALYGFARHTDDLVDDLAGSAAQRRERWAAWSAAVRTDLAAGRSDDPLRAALVDTVGRWGLPADEIERFLAAMGLDLTVTGYRTYEDLRGYMRGSAAAIGLLLLPVLGTVVPAAVAAPYAVDLGLAFQLTNFIRDVAEDLRRGRLYLPEEDLELFGLTREQLEHGVVSGRVRRLLAFEIARTRELYRSAAPGVRLLQPASRPCVQTALELYRGILDEVERADYQVLDRRVAVPLRRRLVVAVPLAVRAYAARR